MKKFIPLIVMLLFTVSLTAQDMGDKKYKQAKEEIKNTFGMVPSMFKAVPESTLPGMWAYFKSTTMNPDNTIPPKYRELMQLSVASQIPCDYCIFFHTESAKAHGATEQEIEEAIIHGTSTRTWSMVLQGNQTDLEEFKEEYREMMSYMAEQKAEK